MNVAKKCLPKSVCPPWRRLRNILLLSTILTTEWGLHQAAFAQTALPEGGKVTSGQANISMSGVSNLTVTQTSDHAIIDWQNFSIAKTSVVRFDNGSGATLNRVIGSSISSLDGILSASGSVFLINPNGIIIGKDGVVNVGKSFVASTLSTRDAEFMAGGDLIFNGGASASVVNLGRVGALGGDIALIATKVRNDGEMSAPSGTVAMVAGSIVLMRDASLEGGKFAILAGDAESSVQSGGSIDAVVAELRAQGGNIYALAGNVSGVVQANRVKQINGKIYLTNTNDGAAPPGGAVVVSGNISVSNAMGDGGTLTITGDAIKVERAAILKASAVAASGSGGSIRLTADMTNGQLVFNGEAQATGNGGNGGAVETSGAAVNFVGAKIDTSSLRGSTGTWLTDPSDIIVDTAAAATIATNLKTTNVALKTTASTASGPGKVVANGSGDITVAAPIAWSSSNTLTLDAFRALNVDALISVTGAGGVIIRYDPSSAVNLSFQGGGAIDFGKTDKLGSLAINGAAYKLIYSAEEIDAIDGIDASDNGTVAVYGSGLRGNYALASDLNATAMSVTEALVGADASHTFSGSFEGLGHSISGFAIGYPNRAIDIYDGPYTGLFGIVSGGSLRDLGLNGGTIFGFFHTGALVGSATNEQMFGLHATNAVQGYGNVGGLAGEISGSTIINSFAGGNITFQGTSGGGLVGFSQDSNISYSFAAGTVTDNMALLANAGGLVGSFVASTGNTASINFAYALGAVQGYANTGGLAGVTTGNATVSNSYASGVVEGHDETGGLVGSNQAHIVNSHASGLILGFNDAGGLVGENGGAIDNSYATGNVQGLGSATGGLIGFNSNLANINNSYATGTVVGAGLVGGLVGFSASSVGSSYATGSVIGDTAVGGLVGYMEDSVADSDYATGAVTAIGAEGGGLIGFSQDVDITRSYEVGAVSGGLNMTGTLIGGLIGDYTSSSAHTSTIQQSFAAGFVSGASQVGGLVGATSTHTLVTNDSVNGSVSGGSNVGGVAGENLGTLIGVKQFGSVAGTSNVGGLVGLNSGQIEYGTAIGATSGGQFTGGLVGYNVSNIIGSSSASPVTGTIAVGGLVGFNSGSIQTSTATGTVSGVSDIGGLVGDNAGLIIGATATGYTSAPGSGPTQDIGGLAGLNSGLITQSAAYGSVGSHGNGVGGLIGEDARGAQVSQSFATGSVVGYIGVGGLIGIEDSTQIVSDSFAMGSVTGADRVGGLIGSGGSVATSFATGDVIVTPDFGAAASKGGLIGYGAKYISNAYWDVATSGLTNGVGASSYGVATGLTTQQFQSGALPVGFSGTIWGSGSGLYPFLGVGHGTPQAITGYAFAANGTTRQANATLNIYVQGRLINNASVSSGANGYYYVIAGTDLTPNPYFAVTQTLPGSPTAIVSLTYTDAPIFVRGNVQDLDVTFGSFSETTTLASTYTELQNALSRTFPVGYYAQVVQPHTPSLLKITAGSAFTIDAALSNAGGNIEIDDLAGPLSVSTDLDLIGSNSFKLTSSGDIDLVGHISAEDGEAIVLRTGSMSDVYFNSGGRISFNGDGGSLTMNGNPYTLLYSLGDLSRADGGSGHFALARSLDAIATNYSGPVIATFRGTFEGLGNDIANVNIVASTDDLGLFGSNSGTVRDVIISGTVTDNAGRDVGGLVGLNAGKVLGSTSSMKVIGTNDVGGLIGTNNGLVRNSASSGQVTGTGDVGGLIGFNSGRVGNVHAVSAVTGGGLSIGGLIGENRGVVDQSWALSPTIGYGSVGGLVGNNSGTISASQAYGGVIGTYAYVGGLAGFNSGAITGSAAGGLVKSGAADTADLGGLVGYNVNGTVDQSNAYNNVVGGALSWNVGGLIGENIAGDVSHSFATGSSNGFGSVGGLIGNNSGSVTQAWASGNSLGGYAFVGGLIGYNTGTVTGDHASGSVDNSPGGAGDLGGLVGYNAGGTIADAFASGHVTGQVNSWNLGGLAGVNDGGEIENSFATGAVSGYAAVGGLVGFNTNQGTIAAAYAANAIAGTAYLGGLVGWNQGSVSYGYWDANLSGQVKGVGTGSLTGITARTTVQLTSGSLPLGFSQVVWTALAGSFPALTVQ